MILAGLGQKFMAVQYAGLKTQACQRNLSAIYTGRNQNSINNKAWEGGALGMEIEIGEMKTKTNWLAIWQTGHHENAPYPC